MAQNMYPKTIKKQTSDRHAIINGLSAPLQWTAKNGSNIPVKVIDQLENMVKRLIIKTAKQNKA